MSTPDRPGALAAARPAALLAGALTGAALCAAAAVRLVGLDARVARLLGYRFAGLPPRPGVALEILAHNAQALLGVPALLLVAQVAARRDGGPARAQRVLLFAGEALLAGTVAVNVLIVGGALGAYGERMACALLPHGPVELAAFSGMLALYLQGRRRALPPRHILTVTAACLALLAAAAVLETFL